MKRFVLIAILGLATACGAYSFPGSTTATGTVSGQVMVTPCAPVEQAGAICYGKPGPGFLITFTSGSSNTTATTDSSGGYSIELPAGQYQVSVKPPTRILQGETAITVTAGQKLVENYVLDSGIRLPVAQQ